MNPVQSLLRRLRDEGNFLTVVLCLAVVGMGLWASTHGWIPTGDDAFISFRSRHLFPPDPVLLNTASSAGPDAGTQFNHPGAFPLLFLAPFTMFGGPGALALGTACVNAMWIALVSVMTRIVVGANAQRVVVFASALLVWSMGATFIFDPWNPNLGMWSVACLVVAAWGVRRGHHSLLPIVVLAGSFAFQTHLSLAVFSFATVAWAYLAVLPRWWRSRNGGGQHRAFSRSSLLSFAVGLLANLQMLWDQCFGTGNLGKILRGSDVEEITVTVRQVSAVVASRVSIPPFWFRGSWWTPVFPTDMPSWGVVIVGLVLAAAVTAIAVRRSGWNGSASSLLGVLGIAGGIGLVVSLRFPLRVGIPLPYFRWLWPLAALWMAALLLALVPSRLLAHHMVRAFLSCATLLAIATSFVPTNEDLSPNPAWAQAIARPLSAAATSEVRGRGPVFVEQSIQEAALWVLPALMDQLDAAGIPVRASDKVLIQQTRTTVTSDGSERFHLVFRGGEGMNAVPAGGTLLAQHDALTPAERHTFKDLLATIGPELARTGAITVTEIGAAETDHAVLEHLASGKVPVGDLIRSITLESALQRKAISIPGIPPDQLKRALELGTRDGGRSIALYLVDTKAT